MNQFPQNCLTTLIFLFLLYCPISAQIIGNISNLSDNSTYLISITPNQTIRSPNNITNTGQITLKAPTGSLEVSDLQSYTGIWQLNTIISQPVEAPDFDYIVFNLVTHIPNPNYQADVELSLFSFKNNYGCLGSIELIENFSDAFWPPNSLDANIGNQLTILQYGINNAYANNNTHATKVTCPNNLKVDLLVSPIKCADETASLKIQLKEGVLPFYYELTLANGQIIKDSLLLKEDSALLSLSVGDHYFLGYNKTDSLLQYFPINAPAALKIDIIEQEKITCQTEDGVKVSLSGSGGIAPNSFQYQWSNGKTGKELSNLLAGTYTVTLTDENNCNTTKDIIIEAIPTLVIDSIEMYAPTCHGEEDGLIELVKIEAGTPPFKYALDKNSYQSENYFENLSAGTYSLNVSDENNCVTTKRITLENPPKLSVLNIQMDTVLLLGQSTQLQPILTGNTDLYYNWMPETFLSCSECPNPTATPRNSIAYTLAVSNHLGCETRYTSQIKVLQKRPIFAPNIFSPNNDGENDYFEIYTGPTIAFGQQLQIFNRWGQLVYDMRNNTYRKRLSWDGFIKGKLADSGVYIYVAKLQLENGNTEIQKGDFFLLK